MKYCGILDDYGLHSLCVKTVSSSADLYKTAETVPEFTACYFEVDLNESQVDIFSDLQAKNDSFAAARALVQFGGDQISVPDHSSGNWEELLKTMNIGVEHDG